MYINAFFVKLFVQRSKFILWLKKALNIYKIKNDLLSIITNIFLHYKWKCFKTDCSYPNVHVYTDTHTVFVLLHYVYGQ